MKMRKKSCPFIILFLSIAMFLCGCKSRESALDTTGLCEVTLDEGKVYEDGDGLKRLCYELSVFNKSNIALKNVKITVSLGDEMEKYLASGITEMQYTFDLFETEERASIDKIGRGAIINWSPMIMDESEMNALGVEFEDIFKYGKEVFVEITWDKGRETHSLKTNIENLL